MNDYNPNVGHIIIILVLGLIFGVAGGAINNEKIARVFTVTWIACVLVCAVIALLLVWKGAESFWWTVGGASEKLNNMSPDRFEVLGMSLPAVRIRWSGSRATEYFDDTDVKFEYFKRFMMGSDKTQIFPKRNCRDTFLPEWAWEEIRKNLEGRGYVMEDSHAGSHSWLWRNEYAYDKVRKHFEMYLGFSGYGEALEMESEQLEME